MVKVNKTIIVTPYASIIYQKKIMKRLEQFNYTDNYELAYELFLKQIQRGYILSID